MPARATIFRWLDSNQEFRRRYALARECLAEDLLNEILEIADDSSRDYTKKTEVEGEVTWTVDQEHIHRGWSVLRQPAACSSMPVSSERRRTFSKSSFSACNALTQRRYAV